MHDCLLSFLICMPLLAGLTLMLLPASQSALAQKLALALTLLELLVAGYIWRIFEPVGMFQLIEKKPWADFWGIFYHLGLDGVGLIFVLLTAVLMVFAALYIQSSSYSGRFCGLLLIFEAGLMGTTLALNLVLFYVFWELMLIPMFFLIGIWGGPNRIAAVVKFVIFTMVGSLVLLFGILYLGVQYHHQQGAWSFALLDLYRLNMPPSGLAHLLMLAFMLAFLIKIPLFPLHTWLPDTYAEAPPVITFLLSAIMAKMGILGLVRIAIPIFPNSLAFWQPLLMLLAVIGIIYGAMLALVQTDLKRLIAYSSISHLSMIALGILAWNAVSVEGALYQTVSHALATGGLFLLVGLIETKYQQRDIALLGGIATTAPIFTTLFVLMMLASVGVPGLNGFVGEFLILVGVTKHMPALGIAAATSLILSAAYLLWAGQRILFGFDKQSGQTALVIGSYNSFIFAPLLVAVIVFGIWTAPLLGMVQPSVKQYIQQQAQPIQAHYQVR